MRQRRPRPVEEEFVVFLQGIPPHCRWQELKDLIRQTALHIRQAVVYDDCHGHPTGIGQIIIKNEDEAWRTYNRLSTNGWNGLSLTVTLSRANDPTKPIAGPTKSPSINRIPYVPAFSGPPLSTAILSPTTCSLAPDSPVSPTFSQPPDYGAFFSPINGVCSPTLVPLSPESLSYALYAFPPNNPVPLQSCYLFNPVQEQHNLVQTRRYQQGPIPGMASDRHHGSGSTTSNNSVTSQVTTPPSKNIFIPFLSHDTTSEHLKEYLKGAGTVERCEVQERKPIGGRPRVFGTATFQTIEEAERAIAMFDGSTFRGTKLRVRFDRDSGCSGNGMARTNREGSATKSPTTPTKDNRNGILESTSPTGARSMDKDNPSPGKKFSEPLVVNGSRVGLKTGRLNLDVICHGDDLSQKSQEILL
ncbi:hypothetical protein VTO42DRAFT_7389 [Malbranchea cinnamomea]